MKNVAITLLAAALALAGCARAFDPSSVADASDAQLSRVEPLSWWTGMKTPLQLMVQGPGIGEYDVCIKGSAGVDVTQVHRADSPDYLFIDVDISFAAESGTCWLVFSKDGEDVFKYPYVLRDRRSGSADRQSYTVEDMIYLIMPDRFANGDPANDSGWPGGS